MYQIVLLGSRFFDDDLKNELKRYSEKLHFFDLDVIEYMSDIDKIDENYPFLILYYGQNSEDAKVIFPDIIDKYVKYGRVLPILKDNNDFNNVMPDAFSEINALELPDKNNIAKLSNYILSYFGFVNYNRKVFISYKRSDTTFWAVKLYDALIKSGFIPFLDIWDINCGANFQERLRNKLSDSEIFLFLNSPNYNDSDYTKEELNIASQLGVGIVQLKFNKCEIFEEAEISSTIEMGDCSDYEKEDAKVNDKIREIILLVERYRAEAFEQKRRFLLDEMYKHCHDIKYKETYYYTGETAIFPFTKIPVSYDIEDIEERDLEGIEEKRIIYNGLYYENKTKRHLKWLDSKCKNVFLKDIEDIEKNIKDEENKPMKIFLSASIPDIKRKKEFKGDIKVNAIRDAIVAFTKVCSEWNIEFYFGGHPAISPLIYSVASEYENATDNIKIYQSEYFKEKIPEEVNYYKNIKWTEKKEDIESSIRYMRECMFEDNRGTVLAIFIGGMIGLKEEAKMIQEKCPNVTIVPLASTGGASVDLYEEKKCIKEEYLNSYAYISLFKELLSEYKNKK